LIDQSINEATDRQIDQSVKRTDIINY